MYKLSREKVKVVHRVGGDGSVDLQVMFEDYSKKTLSVNNKRLLNKISRNDEIELVFYKEILMSVIFNNEYYEVETNNYFDIPSFFLKICSAVPFVGQMINLYFIYTTIDEPRNPLMLVDSGFVGKMRNLIFYIIISFGLMLLSLIFVKNSETVLFWVSLFSSISISSCVMFFYLKYIFEFRLKIKDLSFH